MPAKKSQRLRASKRVAIPWSEKLVDPRSARGRRHGHHGLLGLVAVAFACGRTVLRQMEDLSADQQPLSWRRAMEQLRDALVAILLPDTATAVLA